MVHEREEEEEVVKIEEAARKEQESRKASRAPEILPATTTGRLLFIGS